MVPRTLHASVVLAPWLLLASNVLSQTTPTLTPANPAPASKSTFALRSLNRRDGGLSDGAKVGISIGVTFAAILIVGTIAIFCVKRGRSRALDRPETRTEGPDHLDDENRVGGDDRAKGKETYYMNATPPAQHDGSAISPPAPIPDGFMFHNNGGYPTMPEQIYSPQQQQQQDHHAVVAYHTPYSADSYAHPGTGYPGHQQTAIVDPGLQNGHAGPSSTHYLSEAHLQPHQQQQQQQQQYQQGAHSSWTYSLSATSPSSEEPGPTQDLQYQYLQDHQQYQQTQSPSPDPNHQYQQQHQEPHEHGYYREDAYSPVPPPHPHASELPDQRPPVELMGEGHISEVP
ncbi:hypothetical protein F5Y14DRAFT_51010 [Nemania sp. NC0429]|nr:hypothetical protein F5Y14DRAFT_51010 [Nemania sp. NC0429]